MKLFTIYSALCLAVMNAYAQIPTDNLQAHLPFNGNSNDESVNTNDGQLVGPVYTSDRFGNPSSAIFFDGVNDRMVVAHHASLNFDGQYGDYSISLWVNSSTPKLGATGYRLMEKRLTGQSTEGYPISISSNNAAGDYDTRFHVYDGSTSFTHNAGSGIWHGWHHLVIVVDNSVNAETRVYIDGTLQGITPLNLAATGANAGDLVFGNSYTFIRPYYGDMDDIRLYSDILSECEIIALFEEGDTGNNTTETIQICAGDDYTFPDGSVQNDILSDLIYLSSFSSVLGCDSATIETTVLINAVEASTTAINDSLIADLDSANYQWIDCADLSLVSGAEAQVFEPTQTGEYAVVISQNGCSDTSDCLHVVPSRISEQFHSIDFKAYPNPTNGGINIQAKGTYSIQILDALGKLVGVIRTEDSRLVSMDLSSLDCGIYYLRATNADGQFQTMKLVLQK